MIPGIQEERVGKRANEGVCVSRFYWGQLEFKPAEDLKHHLDCALVEVLIHQLPPSLFESCSQGFPLGGLRMPTESPEGTMHRSERSEACLSGVCGTEQAQGRWAGHQQCLFVRKPLYYEKTRASCQQEIAELISSSQLLAT